MELGTIHIDGHGLAWGWSILAHSVKEAQYGHSQISEELLQSAIRFVHLVCRDPELAEISKLRHSAWDHFTCAEFLQAFIIEWTIVERLLTRRWDRYISEHVDGKKRRESLVDNRDLTISLIIEILCLVGEIDDATYSESHAVRKVRNRVIHSGLIPSIDHAGDCAGLSSKLFSRELDKLEPEPNDLL